MRRRAFTRFVGATTVPWPTFAQGTRRARLGYLSGGSGTDDVRSYSIEVLKERLSQLGWRIGDTIEIEERWAEGNAADLPRLARELVAWKPNILVATGGTETRALQDSTLTTPIVFLILSADPVSLGIVKSIARPGGNTTGFMQAPQLLWGKRIELLGGLLGRPLQRLAYLGNPGNRTMEASWADARNAAAALRSELVRVDVRSAGELERAFDELKNRDAVLVEYEFLLATERHRVAALAARQRLPAVYGNRVQVLAGGLMSYGGDLRDNYRQGASYVHRILNGTFVGDLPVVQASRFELVINLKTARALGLTVSEAFLASADEVID
jgi:putative ABC transport system substrate-binding protein